MMINPQLYRIGYDFHKKWSPYPKTPEAWTEAAMEMGDICRKNGNGKFIVSLMAAIYQDFGEEWKTREDVRTDDTQEEEKAGICGSG